MNVDFGGSRKGGVDRADTKVSGRGKKGGLYLQPGTRVCTIECEDGTSVAVRAGVQGSLVEVQRERLLSSKKKDKLQVNDRLFDNPDLVRTSPENLVRGNESNRRRKKNQFPFFRVISASSCTELNIACPMVDSARSSPRNTCKSRWMNRQTRVELLS